MFFVRLFRVETHASRQVDSIYSFDCGKPGRCHEMIAGIFRAHTCLVILFNPGQTFAAARGGQKLDFIPSLRREEQDLISCREER